VVLVLQALRSVQLRRNVTVSPLLAMMKAGSSHLVFACSPGYMRRTVASGVASPGKLLA